MLCTTTRLKCRPKIGVLDRRVDWTRPLTCVILRPSSPHSELCNGERRAKATANTRLFPTAAGVCTKHHLPRQVPCRQLVMLEMSLTALPAKCEGHSRVSMRVQHQSVRCTRNHTPSLQETLLTTTRRNDTDAAMGFQTGQIHRVVSKSGVLQVQTDVPCMLDSSVCAHSSIHVQSTTARAVILQEAGLLRMRPKCIATFIDTGFKSESRSV
jgi:hypothetical protein